MPIVALMMVLSSGAVRAQDLYDTSVLRTFNLQFDHANWLGPRQLQYALGALDGMRITDPGHSCCTRARTT